MYLNIFEITPILFTNRQGEPKRKAPRAAATALLTSDLEAC